MNTDRAFITELPLYKTAYSPTYNQMVGIINLRYDDLGEPLLSCNIPNIHKQVIFRVNELTNYCL